MNIFDFKEKIEQEALEYLDSQRKYEGVSQNLKDYFSSGGKRLRPLLVVLGYMMCRDEEPPIEVIKAAVAIEFLHDFLLIHDDIMDNSDLRRGKPTLHKILGKELAIVAGDLIFSYANDLIQQTSEQSARIFNEALKETCEGQILDMMLSRKPLHDVTEDEIMRFNSIKTAAYTVEAPLKIGAVLAGANKEQLREIEAFSRPLGQAFQLHDDLIGIFGSEEEIGKPVTCDWEEAKKTLPIFYTFKYSKCPEKFSELFGRKISIEEFAWVRKEIELYGKKRSETLLNSLIEQGIESIGSSSFFHKDVLLSLVERWFR